MPWGTLYPNAPGYETYAPTAAFQYSPAGGTDAYGGYPAYGGGGGGGFLSGGGSSGGSDTSTLGGALSALSLLGGANDLSSFLTGKSLLEHADIPNPFSNFLGGEGLNLQALNPYSNTPLTALFGEAGRNLGLASSAFPNALPGGVGGSVGIGPSGYLSADALAGQVNPFAVTAADLPASSLAVPDVFNPVTGTYASDAYLSQAFNPGAAANAALFASGPAAAAATAEAATAAAMGIDLFGGLGVPAAAQFAAPAAGAGAAGAGAAGAGAAAPGLLGALGPAAAIAGFVALGRALTDKDNYDPEAGIRQIEWATDRMAEGDTDALSTLAAQGGGLAILDAAAAGGAPGYRSQGSSDIPAFGPTQTQQWADLRDEVVEKANQRIIAQAMDVAEEHRGPVQLLDGGVINTTSYDPNIHGI
jgi:hypothetical protein